jgi:hypothetical protein
MLGGSSPGRGFEFFSSPPRTRPVLGPMQPPIQWLPGALSLGIKRPGREADPSPPSSAEVKNSWNYTSTPHYAFMAWCSVNAQVQLYLYSIKQDKKVKVCHEDLLGEWKYSSTHSWPRWGWVVSFTPRPLYSQGKSPLYPLDRRLHGPHSRSRRGSEEKNSQPPPAIEP